LLVDPGNRHLQQLGYFANGEKMVFFFSLALCGRVV
jgi:hypothetical protein